MLVCLVCNRVTVICGVAVTQRLGEWIRRQSQQPAVPPFASLPSPVIVLSNVPTLRQPGFPRCLPAGSGWCHCMQLVGAAMVYVWKAVYVVWKAVSCEVWGMRYVYSTLIHHSSRSFSSHILWHVIVLIHCGMYITCTYSAGTYICVCDLWLAMEPVMSDKSGIICLQAHTHFWLIQLSISIEIVE
jgi:hypothetical protein